MCELFGYSSSVKTDIHTYLNTFYSHSVVNPDGFGLKVLDKESKVYMRQPMAAVLSSKLKQLLGTEFRVSSCIGHIRYATQGKRSVDNCHPFSVQDITGRRWTLAHNGFIKDCKETERLKNTQQGETDSERVLLYIVSCINKLQMKNALNSVHNQDYVQVSQISRIQAVEEAIIYLSSLGKLNLLISDGTLFYEFSNLEGTLYQTTVNKGVMFATKPLTKKGWKAVPLARMQVFKEGNHIYTGALGKEYKLPSKVVDVSAPKLVERYIPARRDNFYAPAYNRSNEDTLIKDPFYVGEKAYPCYNQYGDLIGYKKQ